MAYSIKGNVFLNDDRDLVDINEAGITTSLLVGPNGGETFTVDGVTGIATANGLQVANTVIFDKDESGSNGFRIGPSGQEILSIATGTDLGDTLAANTALPTQLAVKTYVDGRFDNGNTFDFQVEGGTEQNLDLTGDSIDFIGGNNLTASVAVSGTPGDESYALTFDLDSDVTIDNDLVVTNNFSFDGVTTVDTIETALPADGSALDTALPTSKAVRDAIETAANGGSTQAGSIIITEETASTNDYVIPFADPSGPDTSARSLFYAQEVGSELTFNPSTGRLNAQEFNSLSDIRYKENIELIESPMDKINALRGVTYDWKNNGNASAGIIAQEVQAVMPELISETEEKMTVNYNGLTGLLIEAVKELSAEVAALKAAQ